MPNSNSGAISSIFGIFTTIFRWLRRSIFILTFALSVLFNIGLIVSSSVQALVSSAVAAVSGARTAYGALSDRLIAKSDDLAQADADLVNERRAYRELRGELSDATEELTTERVANREIREQLRSTTVDLGTERAARNQIERELNETATELASERAALRLARSELSDVATGLPPRRLSEEVREATADTIERVARRTATGTTRELATAPAEAVPMWGTAVIVSSLALDLWDMCQNMQDLTELQSMIDPDFEVPEDRLEVCSIEVPTRDDIWKAARSAPGEAWSAARDAMPSAQDLQDMEIPDIDWAQLGSSMAESTGNWARSTGGSIIGSMQDAGRWIKRWATE